MICPSGKNRYDTPAAAQRALKVIRTEGKTPERRHYRCPICGGIHLTKQRPKRKRARGRA